MVGHLKQVVANYRAALLDRPQAALAMVILLVLVEGALAWRVGPHAPLAAYLFFGVVLPAGLNDHDADSVGDDVR